MDRGAISKYLSVPAEIEGKCIATALHELGHAWYYSGSNDMSKLTVQEQHNAYITGEGEGYCLMRYDIYAAEVTSTAKFFKEQTKQMAFSAGLRRRLARVFAITR